MADEWRDELRRRLRAMRDPDQRAERMRQYKQAQRAERAAQRKAAAERQPYTVADMTAAQAYLDTAQRRFDDYDGNNPNKHRADLQRARRTLDAITSDLRRRDIIPTPPPPEPTPSKNSTRPPTKPFPTQTAATRLSTTASATAAASPRRNTDGIAGGKRLREKCR